MGQRRALFVIRLREAKLNFRRRCLHLKGDAFRVINGTISQVTTSRARARQHGKYWSRFCLRLLPGVLRVRCFQFSFIFLPSRVVAFWGRKSGPDEAKNENLLAAIVKLFFLLLRVFFWRCQRRALIILWRRETVVGGWMWIVQRVKLFTIHHSSTNRRARWEQLCWCSPLDAWSLQNLEHSGEHFACSGSLSPNTSFDLPRHYRRTRPGRLQQGSLQVVTHGDLYCVPIRDVT